MEEQDWQELSRDTVGAIDKRLRALVSSMTKESRRNSQMEVFTGVPASQWASWWAGRARPTTELLARTCSTWPEYALWLMTGVTDPWGGQVGVETVAAERQEATVMLLRQMAEYAPRAEEWGLDEWQVDQLNALQGVRKRELERRLKADRVSDIIEHEDDSSALEELPRFAPTSNESRKKNDDQKG